MNCKKLQIIYFVDISFHDRKFATIDFDICSNAQMGKLDKMCN